MYFMYKNDFKKKKEDINKCFHMHLLYYIYNITWERELKNTLA